MQGLVYSWPKRSFSFGRGWVCNFGRGAHSAVREVGTSLANRPVISPVTQWGGSCSHIAFTSFIFLLRLGLAMRPRLVWNPQSSCPSLEPTVLLPSLQSVGWWACMALSGWFSISNEKQILVSTRAVSLKPPFSWAGFGRSEGQLHLLASVESRRPSPTWSQFAPLSFAKINCWVGKINSGGSGRHGVPWLNGRVEIPTRIWPQQGRRLPWGSRLHSSKLKWVNSNLQPTVG